MVYHTDVLKQRHCDQADRLAIGDYAQHGSEVFTDGLSAALYPGSAVSKLTRKSAKKWKYSFGSGSSINIFSWLWEFPVYPHLKIRNISGIKGVAIINFQGPGSVHRPAVKIGGRKGYVPARAIAISIDYLDDILG